MTDTPRFLRTDDMPTPYDILGIAYDATDDDIKAARRRLLAEHHPDRNPGNEQARALFDFISASADLLLNPAARALLNIEIAERLQRELGVLDEAKRLSRTAADEVVDTRSQAVKDWAAEVGERQYGDVIVPNPIADMLEEKDRLSRKEMVRYFNMSEKQRRRYDRKQARKHARYL